MVESKTQDLDPSAYSVGWIAALPHERAAAEAMLDEKHTALLAHHKQPKDDNIYTLGSIKSQNGSGGHHNIVIASLPAGRYGITSAATAAANMLSSFPGIKFGLMVGIGGGIADLNDDRDIRLGDVVVGQPHGTFGGVRQYDLGKATIDGFAETGALNCPPRVLLNGVSALQSKHEMEDSAIPMLLSAMWEKYPRMAKPAQGPGYIHQGVENDRLFPGDYVHDSANAKNDCRGCDLERVIHREKRHSNAPFIFYGTIASGNKVIKDPRERDLLAECFCVETEAAGLMNDFPCLVIRGICDYCDSHKNNRWQRYAAATAAAYAKELLTTMDVAEVNNTPEARMIMAELGEIKSATNDIAKHVKQLGQIQARRALYEWLTPSDSSARHSDYQKARSNDTGLWFLQDASFQRWASTDAGRSTQALCCFGNPGAGKTVLTSLVIDHLTTYIATDPSSALAYVYCDYRDESHLKAEGILGTIAKQLLQRLPEVPNDVLQIFDRREGDRAMTLEDSKQIFTAIVTRFSGNVYICLDALDELARGPLYDLMKLLRVGPPLRLYLTGRTHVRDAISGNFEHKDTIMIHAQKRDIEKFILHEIGGPNDVAPKAMDEKLKTEIVAHILGSAQGIFLLPVLQLRAVLQAVTKRDRIECLNNLPQNLGEAFASTLARIERQTNHLAVLARKVITLVHFGLETFTIDSLSSILAIREGDTVFDPKGKPDLDTVLACCHGLIAVESEWSVIRLVHFSLQEYFVGQEKIFGKSRAEWHSDLAAICLTSLFFPNTGTDTNSNRNNETLPDGETYENYSREGSESEDARDDVCKVRGSNDYSSVAVSGFYYAASNWGHHFRKSHEMRGPAYKLARKFLQSSRDLVDRKLGEMWVIIYDEFWGRDEIESDNPSDVVAFFGLTKIGAKYLAPDPDVVHQYGVTPLLIAARMGHEDMVAYLIERGATPNAMDSLGRAPIHHATHGGYAGVVRMLIEAGANINEEGYPPGDGETPLGIASKNGNVAILKILIANGVAIDHSLEDDRLKVSLGSNLESEEQEWHGDSALVLAIKSGHEKVVRILLEAGADVNKGAETPLYVASSHGNESIVRLLISKGANLDARNGHWKDRQWLALHGAVSNGQYRVLKILLRAGASVGLAGGWNRLLYLAARGGSKQVVKFLIKNGADMKRAVSRRIHKSPLHSAAGRNDGRMVQFLLEVGALLESVDSNGNTPLHSAARAGKTVALNVLIKNGAMLDPVNEHGLTPLVLAANRGWENLKALEMLIDKGAAVDFSAGFPPNYDELDSSHQYDDQIHRDVRDIKDLDSIIDTSSTWVDTVKMERRSVIDLMLECSFLPRPSIANIWRGHFSSIFQMLAKKSGKFPGGPRRIARIRIAIRESRDFVKGVQTDWQWSLTMRFLSGILKAIDEIVSIGTFSLNVCHRLLVCKSHVSISKEVEKSLELLMEVKYTLDVMWAVAKRDILYNESIGKSTGLWDALQDSPRRRDRSSKENRSAVEHSVKASFLYYRCESSDSESAGDGPRKGASAKIRDNSSEVRSTDRKLMWRLWDMERLPSTLEQLASALRNIRASLGLRAGDLTKGAIHDSDNARELVEKASMMNAVYEKHYPQLSVETQKLFYLRNGRGRF